MGFGNSKKKKEEPPVTANDLKILLDISQKRCTLARNKRVDMIRRKKDEIVGCLKQNNMDLAMAKMDNLLKDEDFITVYDILNPILEIVKEKCIYIVSKNECPADLRAPLDSIIYAATRVEIEELMKFRDKIKQKYGEAYILKADRNGDKFVNQNLEEKLKITAFSQEVIKIRLKQLCIEKKLNIPLGDIAPGGDWEPTNVDLNMDKNPYESMRPNLPSQSFVQKNSGNFNQGPYPDFGQQPPNQGGFQDGFPRQDPYNNNQGQFQGGFPGNNNQGNQGGYSYNSNQNQSTGVFPTNSLQGNQGGAPWNNNNNNNNNQGSFSQSSHSNNYSNNNNIPPSDNNTQNNKISQNMDDEAIFGKTIDETVPISEKNESQEQSKISSQNNNNIEYNPYEDNNIPKGGNNSAIPQKKDTDELFGEETLKTVNMSTNNPPGKFDITFGKNNKELDELKKDQTMKNSVANPNNQENPFEGDNPFEGTNLELNDQKKSEIKKSGAKDNPFDIDTIPVEELNKLKMSNTGSNPYGQDSKIEDTFGGNTLSAEEGEKMNIKGNNDDGFPSN